MRARVSAQSIRCARIKGAYTINETSTQSGINLMPAQAGGGGWMDFYNRCWPHSSLNGRTPEEAYTSADADRSLGLLPTSGQPNAA